MDAAKGAALNLLQESYKCRDKICLIEFHGERAEVLVPPTKSSALTKNRLEAMPCGGGSPLTHALDLAMQFDRTVYDGLYVALAVRTKSVMISNACF